MRSRNIKPGFFLNEELAEMDFATRLLFIGLWCYADREGRFEWKPKKIHAAIFPYDHDLDVEKMLRNLMSLHLITCHDKVGYIPCFLKHQHPHPHEAKSSLPSYDYTVNQNNEQNQCHDMSLQGLPMSLQNLKCQADIRNPDIMIHNTFSCAELENLKPTEPSEPFLFQIPLIDKTNFDITQKDIDKWQDVFPAVNITAEIKRMILWCDDNPKNRKTRRGINKFCSAWMERAQNKARRYDTNPGSNQPEYKYPIISSDDDSIFADPEPR